MNEDGAQVPGVGEELPKWCQGTTWLSWFYLPWEIPRAGKGCGNVLDFLGLTHQRERKNHFVSFHISANTLPGTWTGTLALSFQFTRHSVGSHEIRNESLRGGKQEFFVVLSHPPPAFFHLSFSVFYKLFPFQVVPDCPGTLSRCISTPLRCFPASVSSLTNLRVHFQAFPSGSFIVTRACFLLFIFVPFSLIVVFHSTRLVQVSGFIL